MRKTLLIGILWCPCLLLFGQKPSLRLKAFERVTISGIAPMPEIAVGDKEVNEKSRPNNAAYYLYLIAFKTPYIKIERVWIKQQAYQVKITKITQKPVVLVNGIYTDTLVRYTDEAVWQMIITGRDSTNLKPKKDIAKLVAANELVLRLKDKNAKTYTRSVKVITKLEAARAM